MMWRYIVRFAVKFARSCARERELSDKTNTRNSNGSALEMGKDFGAFSSG
jgi:hypothetical protein